MTPPAISTEDTHGGVAARWQAESAGKLYATERFHGRHGTRDGRRIAVLLDLARQGRAPFAAALDAPCGAGRLAPVLTRHAARVVGLDVSRSMLAAWPSSPSGTQRVEGSVFALPFPAGSFDVVVVCRLLHHLRSAADRRAALREAARVSSGAVIVSYWDATSWQAFRRRASERFGRPPRDARIAVPRGAFEADLAAAGLRPVARRHSARFVSAQTFVLAEVVHP